MPLHYLVRRRYARLAVAGIFLVHWASAFWVLPSSSIIPSIQTRNRFITSSRQHSSHLLFAVKENVLSTKETVATTTKTTAANTAIAVFVEPDYMVYDTVNGTDLAVLYNFLGRPRNILALSLMAVGVAVTAWNLMGQYSGNSYLILEALVFGLAVVNGIVDGFDSLHPNKDPRRGVSPNLRCGVVDDAVLHAYAALYTLGTVWLGVRTSSLCPGFLPYVDKLMGPMAASIFIFSLVAPIMTLVYHYTDGKFGVSPIRAVVNLARQRQQQPQQSSSQDETIIPTLSETEVLRATSLLAIGVVGCIYTPMVLSLVMKDPNWWTLVCDKYPGQSIVEPSTAMFGILATQASMLSHRAAKAGVAPVRVIVPLFTWVCLLLAVLPCACLLYWLSDSITFFELYSM